MRIMTSYFYMVRFFKPWMIPLSTAVWDPKWYRKNKRPYIDKNGVLNGLRDHHFVPGKSCDGLCRGQPCKYTPDQCKFLKAYKKQLDKIDFNAYMEYMKRKSVECKHGLKLLHEPIFVLIVYETPKTNCSERVMIHRWFREHGYPIEELDPRTYREGTW